MPIFELLKEDTTVDAVVEALKSKYSDATDDEIRENVEAFTAKLKESGVLDV